MDGHVLDMSLLPEKVGIMIANFQHPNPQFAMLHAYGMKQPFISIATPGYAFAELCVTPCPGQETEEVE